MNMFLGLGGTLCASALAQIVDEARNSPLVRGLTQVDRPANEATRAQVAKARGWLQWRARRCLAHSYRSAFARSDGARCP